MAKIELVKKKRPTGWEPFITLTLSEYEAQYIRTLHGALDSRAGLYEFYSELDNVLGEDGKVVADDIEGGNIDQESITLLKKRFE